MHLPNPYRNTTRAHCMQRRNHGRLCKNKDYAQLEATSESETGQGTAGHTGYYRKLIRYYSDMTYPLEELLREDQEFE